MERENERQWFIIHTYSGMENKVKQNLEQRIESMAKNDVIFKIFIPTNKKTEIKKGERKKVERKVYPGYILVEMILNDDSWYVVRNTPGVTGFVGFGNKPTPLMEKEVREIFQKSDVDELQKIGLSVKPKKVEFHMDVGQKVKIIDGPFTDFSGVINEINLEKQSVKCLLKIFGRATSVELEFSQVEEE